MKLKERILMVILGFSLALILVLFLESAAFDLNLGRDELYKNRSSRKTDSQ